MLTTAELFDAADALGLQHVHRGKDFANSIGTGVIRAACTRASGRSSQGAPSRCAAPSWTCSTCTPRAGR